MAACELQLQVMNATENELVLVGWHGISQPPATIDPGVTYQPPSGATSDFQVKGYVTYSDQRGGVINVDFYIPLVGSNDFKIISNPEGRYNGVWIGDTSGWHVNVVAKIEPGPGDLEIDKSAGQRAGVS